MSFNVMAPPTTIFFLWHAEILDKIIESKICLIREEKKRKKMGGGGGK